MRNISELLRDADPLQYEPTFRLGEPDFRRQAVLAAAAAARPPARVGSRSRTAVFAAVALTVIAASFLGSRVRSVFVGDLQGAAVRFEVRLAEDRPAPGLREAKVSGSHRSVYLHDEVIVTNSDISVARVVPGQGPSEYSVGIEFNATGAEKMHAATGNHIGKLLAILLDGQVVMAPVLRSPIGASARITGNFTRPQAEKIVNGIETK
jgi:antitoxin (DNA-binding transcriptional repressor) of toxin-antitoxin stability system